MATFWNKDGTLSNMGDKYSYIRRNIDGVVIERRESSTSSIISSLVDGNRLLNENGLTFIDILDKVVGFIYNNIRYYDPSGHSTILVALLVGAWDFINTASAFLGSLGGPVSTLDSALLSGIFGSVTSAVGMTIDILRNRKNQKPKVSVNNQLYEYCF